MSFVIKNETILQDALAQAEAAFTQAALQALQSDDGQEQAAMWRKLAHTYDKTLAWWPRQAPGFLRLMTLRDWAHQLGTRARGRAQKIA